MQLPGPVRAFVGLIAVTAEEARHLPDRAVELPMLAVSSALQLSLRAQQRYARLTARGDDVLSRRPPSDEPPPWATFDDPLTAEQLAAAAPAHEAEPPKKAPAKRAPRKRPAKKVTAAKKASGSKTINAPRHTSPSRFDSIDDS
jgi:hypothetical protein